VKSRIFGQVCGLLNVQAERLYRQGSSLNALVVFDEAHRFASEAPEDEEAAALATRLVDYVRTTRKYGLGWMFITQEIASLRRGIYGQLRVRAFGYGLTSGTELLRLRETIGDDAALALYRSFVDPAAIRPSQYPFMLTGPISPLSFTGAPVFLSVYTSFQQFRDDNRL
jgi:DNA helicase HerA-like ATPase